jgi:hypothetical protein
MPRALRSAQVLVMTQVMRQLVPYLVSSLSAQAIIFDGQSSLFYVFVCHLDAKCYSKWALAGCLRNVHCHSTRYCSRFLLTLKQRAVQQWNNLPKNGERSSWDKLVRLWGQTQHHLARTFSCVEIFNSSV